MRTTRNSAGAETSSGPLPADGSGSHPSSRFAVWITNHIGRDSSSRADSGAAMVEMAFIFSILIMLLVGVVTSAIAFGQKNSIENAAREASRFAATYPVPDNNPDVAGWSEWLAKVRDVAREAAQGDLDATVDGQFICVYHSGAKQSQTETNGLASAVGSAECDSDGLTDSRVQVVTRRNSEINAAFFSVDVTINGEATARYERAE